MPGTELFLYGTLLNRSVLARQAGDATLHRRAIPAIAPGYRRVILRGTPYPTLIAAPGTVSGLLIRADAAAFARLSAYEGPFYRLVPLRVLTRRGARFAKAWVAASWRAEASRTWERLGE